MPARVILYILGVIGMVAGVYNLMEGDKNWEEQLGVMLGISGAIFLAAGLLCTDLAQRAPEQMRQIREAIRPSY